MLLVGDAQGCACCGLFGLSCAARGLQLWASRCCSRPASQLTPPLQPLPCLQGATRDAAWALAMVADQGSAASKRVAALPGCLEGLVAALGASNSQETQVAATAALAAIAHHSAALAEKVQSLPGCLQGLVALLGSLEQEARVLPATTLGYISRDASKKLADKVASAPGCLGGLSALLSAPEAQAAQLAAAMALAYIAHHGKAQAEKVAATPGCLEALVAMLGPSEGSTFAVMVGCPAAQLPADLLPCRRAACCCLAHNGGCRPCMRCTPACTRAGAAPGRVQAATPVAHRSPAPPLPGAGHPGAPLPGAGRQGGRHARLPGDAGGRGAGGVRLLSAQAPGHDRQGAPPRQLAAMMRCTACSCSSRQAAPGPPVAGEQRCEPC
jgi:hypothetical protein